MNTFLIALAASIILVIIALYFSRREPQHNGYQARQRTYLKGAGVTIIEPKSDPRIVGDVVEPPRSARIADMPEPMGF